MARMRSLKPEFWLDRKLARSLSRDERMLYLGLWNQADEWARAQADPRLIKGQVFPYDDDLSLAAIDKMLTALERSGVVQRYEVDGDPYLFLTKLGKHQRLEPNKVPSRFPDPPELASDQQERSTPQVRANESARDANTLPLKHVAGSREHVARQPRADKSAAETSLGFAEFYAAYPRKEARRKAEQAWRAAVKRATPADILAGLARFDFKPERQYQPMPATWLNQDRWADEPTPSATPAWDPVVTPIRGTQREDAAWNP